MRLPFITTCRVPASLESVTSAQAGAEVNPRAVAVSPVGVTRIWSAVENLYRSGVHPAIQLCVRRHGQVLVNRAIGHASGNGPSDPPGAKKVLVTPSTPFNIFSASKAVTAMIIHLLDQRNLIRLDDQVCDYIPEFGVHEKQWITIRHVLTHRAGIPNLPGDMMNLDHLKDNKKIVRMLCDAEPTWHPGRRLAYHAITGGFLLAELVRRVTGKTIQTVLDEEIRRPLGFRWMKFGVDRVDVKKVALNYFTGPPPLPPFTTILDRALGVPFREVAELSNDVRFLTSVVPSGNVVTTADELSRFYQLLLNGGELDGTQIFDPRVIRRATAEQSYLEIDFTLGLPVRYGMGFMLGREWFSLYGPDTERAYGHVGFTNIISWADPERQVTGVLMTSGKPFIYPELYHVWDIMRQIGLACPKERRRSRKVTSSRSGRRLPRRVRRRSAS